MTLLVETAVLVKIIELICSLKSNLIHCLQGPEYCHMWPMVPIDQALLTARNLGIVEF